MEANSPEAIAKALGCTVNEAARRMEAKGPCKGCHYNRSYTAVDPKRNGTVQERRCKVLGELASCTKTIPEELTVASEDLKTLFDTAETVSRIRCTRYAKKGSIERKPRAPRQPKNIEGQIPMFATT